MTRISYLFGLKNTFFGKLLILLDEPIIEIVKMLIASNIVLLEQNDITTLTANRLTRP
ncbi:hypothetical protein [Kordiimonas sp. SCSIO 12610]|uniref:hypothetical protein n=1 Tax=Kordiimonas sp. SCSIO 12610 TaxID=2829597 RepID=UPI00210C2DA2|nr:hypothetical protein [Kordiimonas sp. SCSIO 12610]UTW54402.1 hypothetical protein KFF44_11325 [Kordiimonas sp. SCSIO 12610]UTW55655.1 hypothetical protein KFF44_01815 [Kordiimonas sp. SCSIO 12610]